MLEKLRPYQIQYWQTIIKLNHLADEYLKTKKKMWITIETLYRLISECYDSEPEDEQFQFIEKTLLSSDRDDGDGHYKLILQDISTSKYYSIYYTAWDIMNTDYNEDTKVCDGRIDLRNNLTEVIPKQVITTIYEEI